jgi:hypothetical protein
MVQSQVVVACHGHAYDLRSLTKRRILIGNRILKDVIR